MKKMNKLAPILSKAVISSLLISPLMTFEAIAQFQKYRSRTKLQPNNQAKPNLPDQAKDDPDFDDSENAEASNQKAFGDRAKSFGFTGPGTNNKYVNLNPETAFGPEIVESFDFPNTDIMELTKHMQKLTGINLILDKDIKGKVSISAPTPITVGDAWRAYLTALEMSGYTLVKSGSFWKIINARDIRYTPTKIYTGNFTPDTDNYIMKIMSLKNISASEVSRNFRPFMSRYGRIIDIKQTNTIIVADTGTNIVRLEKLVKFLDVPGHEESLHIMPVKNSSAQEIAKLLDSILQDKSSSRRRAGGAGGAPPGMGDDASNNISKIIAEPRTNSIIAMANAQGAEQLKDLIYKLDVKLIASGSNRVHVHYLNHGDAEELSKTLSNIISGSGNRASGAGASTGGASSRFTGGLTSAGEDTIFQAEVKVTADKSNNALVVTASPTDWLTLKDVIAKLDIPRDQVYVEGLIMETTVDRNRAFGTSYAGAYGTGAAQRAGFNAGGDILSLISGQFQNLSGMFVGIGGGGNREIQIGEQKVTVSSVNGVIKAVAGHSQTNILATPQILASDNTEATFEVGETVPTLTTTAAAAGGFVGANLTQQKVALVLKLKPQINKITRFIKLNIDQRIDDFNSGKAVGSQVEAAGGVATTTRSTVTEVIVRDKDTIAMGGLMRDKEVSSFSKVPLLGDIPVLGWLFKNQSRNVEKVNMLFFMTPRILAPYEKVAGSNTQEVIEKRNKHLETILDKDTKDPFKGQTDEIQVKAQSQTKGALYDPSYTKPYENINKGIDTNVDDLDDVEEIDYQKIIQEVKTE
jgi:general secretion pathway protein D